MTTVGILGGGQLARMLALAGYPLGLRFRFLDPAEHPPAAALGAHVRADYDDRAALDAFARGLDVVTYEIEHVPVETAAALNERLPLHPSPDALVVTQDRWLEKQFLQRLGVPTAPCAAVDTADQLDASIAHVRLPAIMKRRRGGYDGIGQAVVATHAAAVQTWRELGEGPVILEALLPFARELSIIVARGRDGAVRAYPPTENRHVDGILRSSRAPVAMAPELHARAAQYTQRILEGLDYVGTLAIELFEVDGQLIVNEVAPRVHNSGHWTIEGAETSQFENHLRAILGLPLGSTAARGVAAMVNLLGSPVDPGAILGVAGAHLHLYDKAPRPRRKLGHVTICAGSHAVLDERLAAIERLVGATAPPVAAGAHAADRERKGWS